MPPRKGGKRAKKTPAGRAVHVLADGSGDKENDAAEETQQEEPRVDVDREVENTTPTMETPHQTSPKSPREVLRRKL